MIKKEKKKILILDTSTLFYRAAFSKLDELKNIKKLYQFDVKISDLKTEFKKNICGNLT